MADFKTVKQNCADLLATMASANFAMVMSTGIVSIALHLLGYPEGAYMLYVINIALFWILIVLYFLRLGIFPRNFMADFRNHNAGPGFLTVVAGTCILGNQYALLSQNYAVAAALLYFGALLWVILLWGVFYYLFTSEPKPPVEKGINGAWLVATVSTQSIVISGSTLVPHMNWNPEAAFFIFTAMFMLGFILYLLVISMIFYRFCYKELPAASLSPTYWINAGAIAITTLAGSELISKAAESPLLSAFLPFIQGLTMMAWATASFWIIMLFMLGIWRHGVKHYPFTYTPEYWGLVFPTGTYTACTIIFAHAMHFDFIMFIPEYFIFIACFVWICTFAGMIYSTGKSLFVQ